MRSVFVNLQEPDGAVTVGKAVASARVGFPRGMQKPIVVHQSDTRAKNESVASAVSVNTSLGQTLLLRWSRYLREGTFAWAPAQDVREGKQVQSRPSSVRSRSQTR